MPATTTPSATVIVFPSVRRLNPADRAAILAWTNAQHGVALEFDAMEDDAHEYAALGLTYPGDEEQDTRWFTLARFGRVVTLENMAARVVASGATVGEVLATFGTMLPGAPRAAA